MGENKNDREDDWKNKIGGRVNPNPEQGRAKQRLRDAHAGQRSTSAVAGDGGREKDSWRRIRERKAGRRRRASKAMPVDRARSVRRARAGAVAVAGGRLSCPP